MLDLKTFRREWSTRHKELRSLFKSGAESKARELFSIQHAVLHSRDVSGGDGWSYSDWIFPGLEADQYRLIPKGEDHSLVWVLWHISRIEDITIQVLVGDGEQIYLKGGWKEKLGSPVDHTGNAAPPGSIPEISKRLGPEALLDYRNAVGRGTRQVFRETPAASWRGRVQPGRLDRLVVEGAVLPEASELLDYWGKREIFELFLMPPTRHLMSHLNEANSIKAKILKS